MMMRGKMLKVTGEILDLINEEISFEEFPDYGFITESIEDVVFYLFKDHMNDATYNGSHVHIKQLVDDFLLSLSKKLNYLVNETLKEEIRFNKDKK
jgi:hypothetical protein